MKTSQTVRKLGLILAAGVLLALASGLALNLYGKSRLDRATNELENAVGTLDLSSFEKPAIPDEENAARWLEAGAGALVLSKDARHAIGQNTLYFFHQWPPELETQLRSLVELHHGALETMHIAAPIKQSSYNIKYSDGLDAEIPDLVSLMWAQRLLLAEARLAFADGNVARGMTALATMSRMSSTIQEESAAITAIIGSACERLLLVAVVEVVTANEPWAADAELLGEIGELIPPVGSGDLLKRVFHSWAATIDSDELFGTAFSGSKGRTALFGNLTRAEILENVGQLLELVRVPFATDPDRFVLDGSSDSAPSIHPDLQVFVINLGKVQATEALRQLVHAALRLRAIQLTSGRFPAERSEIPELAIPDPFTGRDIVYEPHDDESLRLAIVVSEDFLARVFPRLAAQLHSQTFALTLPPLS